MQRFAIGLSYCNSIGISDKFSHMQALDTYLKTTNTTQADFARRLGVSQPTISDIIRGVHSPSVKLLKRISEETGISVDQLLSSEAPRRAAS